MKPRVVVTTLLAVVFALAIAATDKEELYIQNSVIRPDLVEIGGGCLRVANQAPIFVSKGFIIEIDFSYVYSPSCLPRAVTVASSGNGVLKRSKLGTWHISNGASGGPVLTGFFFKAHKTGTDTIQLVIDGVTYSYDVTVH